VAITVVFRKLCMSPTFLSDGHALLAMTWWLWFVIIIQYQFLVSVRRDLAANSYNSCHPLSR